ncbi:MAG: nucleoside hydrolase [Bacteroidota bacterium]
MKKLIIILLVVLSQGCNDANQAPTDNPATKKKGIPIIIDTDANNELDDQHALAYAFFNEEVFDIIGVSVNATHNGGDIESHLLEAKRVMQLCDVEGQIPLKKGANGNFSTIESEIVKADFDGREAVNFIIEEALKPREDKLVLVPIGKLTNIALAIKKAPEILGKIRIVWLGSNYPQKGEYNLVNDIEAMNYLLDQKVQFEMVMVRYGEPSGSDAVRITPDEITEKIKGYGPKVAAVGGRHGATFTHFGDYAENLFSHIELHGDPPSRALFDVVALAILKNPAWGESRLISSPIMENESWVDRPKHAHKITIWENFDQEMIIEDFIKSIQGK